MEDYADEMDEWVNESDSDIWYKWTVYWLRQQQRRNIDISPVILKYFAIWLIADLVKQKEIVKRGTTILND